MSPDPAPVWKAAPLGQRVRGMGDGQAGLETFGTDDIERAVGEVSYLRGLDYFVRGMVRSVEFGPAGRIYGEVSGSRPKPYAVAVKYEFGSDGMLLPLEGHCSCPVGYNCKHTVAVLLAARHVSPGADHGVAGTAREGVSRDVRRWLDDWPGAVAARPEARRDGPPEPGRDHLFYVIHRDATGGMRIDPYRAYLKKDGTIGRNFREYREGTASAQRKFLTSEDAALLGRLGYFEESIWPRHYDWPDGEELIGLVRGIVETGRARADDIGGMALSWAEPRRCELAWTVGEAGRQHVAARDEAGSPLTLLPFPTPLFLDPETGEIGVAETGLPARLASWFAAAPPVEHRSIHAVAAQLSRIGQHAPVPRLHRVEERSDVRPEPVLKLFGCEHRPMRHTYDGRRIVGVGGGDALVYPCARLEIVYPGAGSGLRVGRGDDIAAQDADGFAVIQRDRAREAGFGETLREAAKPYGQAERDMLRYDYGRLRELRDADVVFPPLGGGEDDGAGLGFVIQAVPRLRSEGWRIEVDESWPFRLHDGPVAFAHDMAYRLLADMRIDIFRRLDALAPAYLVRRRSGDLVGVATHDVELIEYFFAHTIAPAFVAALVPAVVLATLAWFGWEIAAALLPFLAYAGLGPVLGRSRIDRLGSRAREASGDLSAFAVDSVQGLGEIVAFQHIRRRGEEFAAKGRAFVKIRLPFLSDLAMQTSLQEVATGLGGLAVIVVGGVLIAEGRLESGILPLLTLLAMSAFLPVSEIAQVGRQLADTLGATRRVHAVNTEPIEVTDGPGVAEEDRVDGVALEMSDIDFTYPGRTRPALSGVSFTVPTGATVALVGPSGAGKTTVANLFLRFWDPARGVVKMAGHDLGDSKLDDLRRRIALVAQDTYLFNDTLRNNILIARPSASEPELEQAVDKASLSEFVATLPDGLQTIVGERGAQLSGGQRQRVAIARAFLKDAPVLILDEATSHLDAVNEQAVRGAMKVLMRDRTTVVIAHRLSTIRDTDQIIVLEEGRVVEVGAHDVLLKRGGLYAHLVSRQLAAGTVSAA